MNVSRSDDITVDNTCDDIPSQVLPHVDECTDNAAKPSYGQGCLLSSELDLIRQIHPARAFFDQEANEPTKRAFKLNSNDNGELSVSCSELIKPYESWVRHNQVKQKKSVGVVIFKACHVIEFLNGYYEKKGFNGRCGIIVRMEPERDDDAHAVVDYNECPLIAQDWDSVRAALSDLTKEEVTKKRDNFLETLSIRVGDFILTKYKKYHIF